MAELALGVTACGGLTSGEHDDEQPTSAGVVRDTNGAPTDAPAATGADEAEYLGPPYCGAVPYEVECGYLQCLDGSWFWRGQGGEKSCCPDEQPAEGDPCENSWVYCGYSLACPNEDPSQGYIELVCGQDGWHVYYQRGCYSNASYGEGGAGGER